MNPRGHYSSLKTNALWSPWDQKANDLNRIFHDTKLTSMITSLACQKTKESVFKTYDHFLTYTDHL